MSRKWHLRTGTKIVQSRDIGIVNDAGAGGRTVRVVRVYTTRSHCYTAELNYRLAMPVTYARASETAHRRWAIMNNHVTQNAPTILPEHKAHLAHAVHRMYHNGFLRFKLQFFRLSPMNHSWINVSSKIPSLLHPCIKYISFIVLLWVMKNGPSRLAIIVVNFNLL